MTDATIQNINADATVDALSNGVGPSLDQMVASQWHLSGLPYATRFITQSVDINVMPVWTDYTGAGVRIGIIDQAFDILHADLAGRFDLASSYDPRDPATAQNIRPDTLSMSHGTMVAGLIGAANNGTGVMGVAFDSTLIGSVARFGSGGSSTAVLSALMARQVLVDADVVNCSWGTTTAFSDNFAAANWQAMDNALAQNVTLGRDGLGTIVVFAAGNDRVFQQGSTTLDGDNTNSHNLTNDKRVITVAASTETGTVASFSTPGASVFVAAPGDKLLTTRPIDTDGNVNNDFVAMTGTSAAAPVVSGVIALMLEANELLGYRDVQAILAASSQRVLPDAAHWQTNGAITWNGGGYTVSHDLGFGVIDAHAAVRLAETWTKQSTTSNLVSLAGVATESFAGAIPQNGAIEAHFSPVESLPLYEIEWVEVHVDITHTHIGDLRITLIGPDGTQSLLVNLPGNGTNSKDDLRFKLSSNQFWGEGADGQWTVRIEDIGTGGFGQVNTVGVTFHGSQAAGLTYLFTNDYSAMAGDRDEISATGGIDVLNAAAVTTGSLIDLAGQSDSVIDGKNLSIAGTDHFEIVFGGDGNDTILGGTADEKLNGGRGDDIISAGAGRNVVTGGAGTDTLRLAGNRDSYVITFDAATDSVTFRKNGETTTASQIERVEFADQSLTIEALKSEPTVIPVETIPVEMSLTVAPVSEGAVSGSIIGAIRLQNAEAARFTYTLTSNSSGLFQVDAITGIVSLGNNAELDFETAQFHEITVSASDGVVVVDKTFTIDVTDVTEGVVAADSNFGLTEQNGISASLDLGLAQRANGEFIVLAARNGIVGTAATDFLFGNDDNNHISGGNSADLIMGMGGDDVLQGDGGWDNLFGGDGNDRLVSSGGGWLQGDAGNDSISFIAKGTDDGGVAIGGAGNDEITIDSLLTSTFVAVSGDGDDRVQGGGGADWLQGDAGDDIILGGGGNDTVIGGNFSEGTGNDLLFGGAGDDLVVQVSGKGRLFGDAGNDWVAGAAGADEINGGAGSDSLFGGAGADTFVINAAEMAAGDHDQIFDFTAGSDKLLLAASVRDQLVFTEDSAGLKISNGNYDLFIWGQTQAAVAPTMSFIL